MMYLLDANVLITADNEYYPLDRVPQFWEWIYDMANAGHIKIPHEVHSEIKLGALKDWVNEATIKKALLLDEAVNADLLNRVLVEGYGPDLTDNDLEKIGRDAFLIAYGLAHPERTVITKETSEPRKQKGNRKVPDVCDALDVKWGRDFEMFKILNFKTR